MSILTKCSLCSRASQYCDELFPDTANLVASTEAAQPSDSGSAPDAGKRDASAELAAEIAAIKNEGAAAPGKPNTKRKRFWAQDVVRLFLLIAVLAPLCT